MSNVGLSIGEVARRSGLKASAIRFYEQDGLLPKPVRQSGQRRYTDAIFDRLALLDYAKRSGFTLSEIRTLFRNSVEKGSLPSGWRELAKEKIRELDLQAEQIAVMKALLERISRCRCIDIEQCGKGIRAAEKRRTSND
jgi:MerR family redox-sensitive transcriptional activator SoxR